MDLRTTYMGFELKNPLVHSASPLSQSVDNIRRLEDAGAAAVVMFSIFEEQLRQEEAFMEGALNAGADSSAEASTYFAGHSDFAVGPERYLDLLRQAKAAVKIPVIGSLNGITNEGWIEYARRIEQAGADGLELNIYWTPTETALSGAEVENRYLEIITSVKRSIKIPVAVKLNPFFSAFANMAQRIDATGVDAMVLFNRLYQPDIDLDELEVAPHLSLSTPYEIRLPLLWIAVLAGRVKASLGATRGVHSHVEVVKYLMAGADAVMMTSVLLKHGIPHLGAVLAGLTQWMEEHEYTSVAQMKGSMSQASVADPESFTRLNYIRTLESYKRGFISAQ